MSNFTQDTVPVVNINEYVKADDGRKAVLAKAVDEALQNTGFLVIAGHGVTTSTISETYCAAKAFFDLPIEQKMRYARAHSSGPGYRPLGRSALAKSRDDETPPDLKENFIIGPTGPASVAGDSVGDTVRLDAASDDNLWPNEPSDFRLVCTRYYQAMERLSNQLLELFATALKVERDFFLRPSGKHTSFLSIINYPEQHQAPVAGQLRAGAHTDYGTLTVLYKDQGPSGGLQVQRRSGEWCDVEPPAGSFVVNIGDLMARWTNDRWVSTVHRVINPVEGKSTSSRRLSIAYFNQPYAERKIAPVPTCVSEANPQKYEEVTAAAYLEGKRVRVTIKE